MPSNLAILALFWTGRFGLVLSPQRPPPRHHWWGHYGGYY